MTTSRNRDLGLLHPTLRAAVPLVLSAVNAGAAWTGYVLRLFEGARSPSRQRALYAQGRDPASPTFGRTVTKAREYQSAHQFGEGADLVFVDAAGNWTWSPQAPWHLLRSEAKAHGLETLSFEEPHVQLRGFAWNGRPIGPPSDLGWIAWLAGQVGAPPGTVGV